MNSQFKEAIKDSILNVERGFFQQITTYTSRNKYNERVFCYELYHQLRLNQDRFKGLTISGEAVKSQFQFKNLKGNRTPDLLIHNFGSNDNNEVVVEVKTTDNLSSVVQGFDNDFCKLDIFTDSATYGINYKLGIYLLINHDFKNLILLNEKITRKINKIINNNKRLEVWNVPNLEFTEDNTIKESCLIIYTNNDLKVLLNSIVERNN